MVAILRQKKDVHVREIKRLCKRFFIELHTGYIALFTCLFIRSFVRSFVRLFNQSFPLETHLGPGGTGLKKKKTLKPG